MTSWSGIMSETRHATPRCGESRRRRRRQSCSPTPLSPQEAQPQSHACLPPVRTRHVHTGCSAARARCSSERSAISSAVSGVGASHSTTGHSKGFKRSPSTAVVPARLGGGSDAGQAAPFSARLSLSLSSGPAADFGRPERRRSPPDHPRARCQSLRSAAAWTKSASTPLLSLLSEDDVRRSIHRQDRVSVWQILSSI